MRNLLLFTVFIFTTIVFSQKNDATLFTIDNNVEVITKEYKEMFLKTPKTETQEVLNENLQLFVDYKLKLIQAKELGIDTLPTLHKELRDYKKGLIKPFLSDTIALNKMLKESYDRSLYRIKASHILIKTVKNDTLAALNKIKDIRNKVIAGADFGKMALEFSEDPSAKKNKGSLGYFSVFNMVYPFESAAYNTAKGKVSEIVKTQFGYHILWTEDKMKSQGKMNSAHIMIAGFGEDKKARIDSVYTALQNGSDFGEIAKKISQDSGSSSQGGVLKPYTRGSLHPSFEEVAFNMTEKGSFSKPFKSHVGWHVIKYNGIEAMPTYDEFLKANKRKVFRGVRGDVLEKDVYADLEQKFNVVVNNSAKAPFKTTAVYGMNRDSLQNVLFNIGDKKIYQHEYADFVHNRRIKEPLAYFNQYKKDQIKEYLTDHIDELDDESKKLVKTYNEGLQIFELMKQKIWDVAQNKPDEVEAYYNANKEKYKDAKDFASVKGYVQSDFQDQLQADWLTALRAAHTIEFKKRTLKKLKKQYQ